MDLNTIFNGFAFPVAVVIACMYGMVRMFLEFMKRLAEKDAQITAMAENHREESAQISEAVKGLQVVMERVCTLLGDKEGTQ